VLHARMNPAIDKLRAKYVTLPDQYLEFLARTNGAEGELALEPGWVQVWPAEEALVASEEYEIPQYLPGYFAFGGNGGGELFVFPLSGASRPIFMVPAVGMSREHLIEVATDFASFERAMAPRT
jgi:hypothetical protein